MRLRVFTDSVNPGGGYHYGCQSWSVSLTNPDVLNVLLVSSWDLEGRVMTAVGQHVPGKSNALSPRILGLAIPWRRVALYLSLAVGFFALGFVPMWLKVSRAIEQRDAAQKEVRLTQLGNTLGTAVLDVQQGRYEPARQLTSDFYTKLRAQIDDETGSVFTNSQREKLRPLLSERDELITLLARSDPAASSRLFAVYSTYKTVSNGS
jgi:hypothetical protein